MASAAPCTGSELAEQLRQVGLDAEYWVDILKRELGINLPQQIQYLDETHLNALKDFITQGWEEKALTKFLGINSVRREGKDGKSEIFLKLTDAGLDGEYWADVLKTKLGITRMEQTANLNIKDLKKLEGAVKYDWEENALIKLFGISEETYEGSLGNLQKHKQTLELAKNLLDDIVETRQKGIHYTDDKLKSNLDQLRKLMNDELWVEKYDDKGLDDMIGKMSSDLQNLGKLAEGRPLTSAAEVLANASAGLALRGILVGKAFSDDCVKHVVLSKPSDVKLMNPLMVPVDDVVHFSSKAQSDHFHRSIDTMGYSVAAAAKGWGCGFNAQAGVSLRHEKEDQKESISHEQSHFESRVIYSVVPTAACELDPYSLKLSQQALHELRNIDKLLAGSTNSELVNKKCEEFLISYGSHINAGVLHFGGVNKFVATYTSETKSKTDKIKPMVQDALGAYASASYSGIAFGVCGSVSADHIKTNASFTADYEKTELAKTSLHTTRNGGPQDVSALPLWKMGLVTFNSTWALIDRGKMLFRDFVEIWKLIPNHAGEFQKPHELASSLLTVWEKMSGYTGSEDQGQTVIKGLNEMDLLMNKIATWNSRPLLPERCIEYLQEMLKTVEQVEAQTGTNKYWKDKLCKELDVSSFLGKVVELKSKFHHKDVSMIRYLLRKLVNPAGFKVFPGKQKIVTWAGVITETVDVPSILAGVKSIPDLMRNVKETFLPDLQVKHAKNTEANVQVRDSINTGATVDLARCICELLKNLQYSGESHELLFLKVTLLSLHYHWPTMKFETLLTMENLQHFVQHIESLWKEFLVHKEKGIIQLEAFLIHISLTAGHFDEEKESSEDEFSEITKDLRSVLSSQLNKVLNMYATRSPFNWSKLTSITGELAKGNISVAEEKEVDIGDLQDVFASRDRTTLEEGPFKTYKHGVATRSAFSHVLKTLGLDQCYPSKISLLDAMVIKKATRQPKLVDLPWMIIHKILMIDYHARDQPLPLVKELDGGEKPNGGGEGGGDFGLDDFLLETKSTRDDEDKATHLNSLDVLVAIFTCCDNFLKQALAQKLFVCKLAIPFLYPLGTEGDVMMSLWALRTITVQWHTKHKEASETPVTETPFPLVTFVRLGRPPLSKSKLMNDILSDASHYTFFNHDCYQGTVPRRLTDGLVECTWFISAGKEKEHLPGTAMFLNLRGDASSMEKQMHFLQEISSVVCVIVTARDLARTSNTNTCRQILKTSAKVILFLISGNNTKSIQELGAERKACVEAVGKNLLKKVPIISSSSRQGIQKNASELKTESRRALSESLTGCSGMGMEECIPLAKKYGIIIDENSDRACLEGKILAEKVVSHVQCKDIVNCKRFLLPLQGAEWIKYCKLLKEQHRASGKGSQLSAAYQADQVKQQMDHIREEQMKICHNRLSPFIKDFMSNLQKNQDVVLYFLKWVDMFFDEISRANLPVLRKQYHTLWTQFQEAKTAREQTRMEQLKSQVDDAENKLASASFGLENLFRELGQIYEAVKGSSQIGKDTKVVVEYLPEIAAKLLMNGSPLELVDGDASSVPISWINAVLSKLGNIIGEKKLFVLSVLGIQSSGKSTLLNTMFGLQFAVNAGRCTRGAYMQLVPVDKHAELSFDYVVVVDTEGLRAPELGQLKYEHDNELATLVIGLGDVTMVNIKGENTAEIKDILQIAVHAFLRMNLVKKHIKDYRTCIFVHQNVAATNAGELVMHGCQKLQEDLDDMVKEAALSENIANIHSFSQIINFDVQKHVWFFSDLWHGNPPMAPSNPGYSENVDAVRLNLLEEVAKGQKSFLTPSNLSIRLTDLWNGVLADDFVFSFRNSLEVKAYNGLQSKYYTLEWELEKELKTWLQKAEIKLKICETIEDLEGSFELLIGNLSDVLTEKAANIETCLTDYFEKSNLLHILIQWQQSKMNQLNIAVEQQLNEGKIDLLSIKETRRLEILQSQMWSNHEAHILNKAVELADKLQGKEVTDTELQKKFGDMWVTMMHELATKVEDKELRMDLVMEQILRKTFQSQGKVLREELKSHPLNIPFEQISLRGSITLDDVGKEHISLKTTLWENVKNLVRDDKSRALEARNTTLALTDSILKETSTYLKDVCSHDMKFRKSHATEVVQKLVEKIDSHNQNAYVSDSCFFTILPSYVVKLAVHVSRYCVQVFSSMQFAYNKKHGVKAKLEDYKSTAWSLFKNVVKQSTQEVMAGDLLCTQLKGIIQRAVKKEIPRNCIGEVLRDFQMTKYYLIVKIMDDLACKGNFKEYRSYINNAKEFALRWITQYTNAKMFSRQNGSSMSRYADITKSHVLRIITCIKKSVEHATDEVEGQTGMRMALWIDKFCQRVSEEIAVPVSSLKHVSDRQVGDFSNLKRIILDQLVKNVQANLVDIFANETEYSVDWDGTPPPEQILDKIWGCPEQCPFCHEPCADTTADHYSSSGRSHMCVQHRPKGIAGIVRSNDGVVDGVEVYKGQLRVESCNFSVYQENASFRCSACHFKCRDYGKCSTTGSEEDSHKYKEYKTFLPAWDIAPNPTNSVSKYWMWLMNTYQYQLKDMYEAQLPDIPESWRSVSKEDALIDLRQIHH